jgi:hypothetical protein
MTFWPMPWTLPQRGRAGSINQARGVATGRYLVLSVAIDSDDMTHLVCISAILILKCGIDDFGDSPIYFQRCFRCRCVLSVADEDTHNPVTRIPASADKPA